MHRILFIFLLSTLLSCQNQDQSMPPEKKEALLKTSQEASQKLMKELKTQLVNTMKAGGPPAALEVCHTQAPLIAIGNSTEKMTLRRTSLKPRNPSNAPKAYEKQILEQWQNAPQAIQAKHQIIQTEFGPSSLYMQPITIQKACLQCHGSSDTIHPEVAKKLNTLYPQDQATGYKEGDLRGAVVVEIALE